MFNAPENKYLTMWQLAFMMEKYLAVKSEMGINKKRIFISDIVGRGLGQKDMEWAQWRGGQI